MIATTGRLLHLPTHCRGKHDVDVVGVVGASHGDDDVVSATTADSTPSTGALTRLRGGLLSVRAGPTSRQELRAVGVDRDRVGRHLVHHRRAGRLV